MMDVFFAVYFALLALVLVLVMVPGLLDDGPGVRDIARPCRGHDGVAHFIPGKVGLYGSFKATVICRDGKVGRL